MKPEICASRADESSANFLTFADVVLRLKRPKEYVHFLIAAGHIAPAVLLSEAEQYPGGEFRGGYFVGDIEESIHTSYSERFVSTDIDDAYHYENRPRCAQIVFCHHPLREATTSQYRFQFFSESPYPGDTTTWFYFDRGHEISGLDGERRFLFTESQIDLLETSPREVGTNTKVAAATAADRAKPAATPSEEPAKTSQIYKKTSRASVLDLEIKMAMDKALNANSVHSVWGELVKLAESRIGCLLGCDEDSVKYSQGAEVQYFSKKNLRDRMGRKSPR